MVRAGQYLISPAVIGAVGGASVGVVQREAHGSDTPLGQYARDGAGYGLGLGAAVLTGRLMKDHKLGMFTNPFANPKLAGLSPQQKALVKLMGGK